MFFLLYIYDLSNSSNRFGFTFYGWH